jgi:hypothetical protein
MGMKKKFTKKIYEPFESYKENGRFIKWACDMQSSPAWEQLKISQIGLYLILKSKFTLVSGEFNTNNISFPKSEWIKYYSRKPPFDKDIDALINLGFIRVIIYQANLKKPTIYGFSDQWKFYNTEEFNVTDKDRRPKNTLTKEQKKVISEGTTKSNAKRYKQKGLELL